MNNDKPTGLNMIGDLVDARDVVVEALKQAVDERDRCLDGKNLVVLELMARISELDKQLEELRLELKNFKEKMFISHLPMPKSRSLLILETNEFIPKLLPELTARILSLCDARSRRMISQMNRIHRRNYKEWTDVKHIYICRTEPIEEKRCTIIPQSYMASTNVENLGPFRFYDFQFIFEYCSRITTLILESSQANYVTNTNRLPQPGNNLWSKFINLEVVKFCNIRDNMSMDYSMSDLLNLPKLKVVHIRETTHELDFPASHLIKAPIEDVRICVKYQHIDEFISFCLGISQTIKKFSFSVSHKFFKGEPNGIFRGEDFMRLLCGMPFLEEAFYPKILLRSTDYANIARFFPMMSPMFKKLTVEELDSRYLHDISEYMLDGFEQIIVTDHLLLQGEKIRLNTLHKNFNELLTEPRNLALALDCRQVVRPLQLQLGFLRANGRATVHMQMGQVSVSSNLANNPTDDLNKYDKRVFFWNDRIHSRKQFLNHFCINVPQPELIPLPTI